MQISFLLLACGCGLTAGTSLWPSPASVTFSDGVFALPPSFNFTSDTPTPILSRAFARYLAILGIRIEPLSPTAAAVVGTIASLAVTLQTVDEALAFNTSEAYELRVAAGGATLTADTVFGALRGLETFSQLTEFSTHAGGAVTRAAVVRDAPRFRHRGALVDTSRHFVGVPTLLSFLDAMAYNKLNVFHWHIVECVWRARTPPKPWPSHATALRPR